MATFAHIKYRRPGTPWQTATITQSNGTMSTSEIMTRARNSFPGAEIEIESVENR